MGNVNSAIIWRELMNNVIVVKRDDTEVPYDRNKIVSAVSKAIKEVDGNLDKYWLAENIAKSVDSYMEAHTVECITVEEIQDLVENLLIYPGDYPEIARAYIRYRYKKELLRKSNTTDQAIHELLEGTNEYWNTENSTKMQSFLLCNAIIWLVLLVLILLRDFYWMKKL